MILSLRAQKGVRSASKLSEVPTDTAPEAHNVLTTRSEMHQDSESNC